MPEPITVPMISRTMSRKPSTRAKQFFGELSVSGRSAGGGTVSDVCMVSPVERRLSSDAELVVQVEVQQAPVDRKPGEPDASERDQRLGNRSSPPSRADLRSPQAALGGGAAGCSYADPTSARSSHRNQRVIDDEHGANRAEEANHLQQMDLRVQVVRQSARIVGNRSEQEEPTEEE